MKRWFFLIVLSLSLALAGCGDALSQMPFTVTITPQAGSIQASPQAANSPESLASETQELTVTPELSATVSPTVTLTSTVTETLPPPTETLLPPLDIPTEKPNAPALVAWTGEPTYPGDSEPGRLYRVDYDPDIWAQTKDNFEQVVLAHRSIDYCTITAWSGRGLPKDATVEHVFGQVGNVPFDINTVTMEGKVKFVAYVGGDKRLLTGFQITFVEQREQCLLDAEKILATLRSFVAEPTITPTFTPEPLESATFTATP